MVSTSSILGPRLEGGGGALIFAAPGPRPRYRLRIKGFEEGSPIIAVPLYAPVLSQETGH